MNGSTIHTFFKGVNAVVPIMSIFLARVKQ